MYEYPSIRNTRRIPCVEGIAFDKIDGSNFRAKWSHKHGFTLFGTRTQLVDNTTPYWSNVIDLFKAEYAEPLHQTLSQNFKNEKQAIVFSEFFGENSFAGRHREERHKLITFDVMLEKNKKFLLPQDFVKVIGNAVEIPRVVYRGKNDAGFVMQVRKNEFDTNEGVIFKGTSRTGSFSGGVLMCKIKTYSYLDKLKEMFKDDWEKYGE
jgi:hypothetical protein